MANYLSAPLGYVVLNEHTLGIRSLGKEQWLVPLAFKPGGYDPAKGAAVISPRDHIRKATPKDFVEFGIEQD